ncbi:MAG: NAD(P)-binding domain-containing protein [Pirellulaceae bacterium]
MNIRYNTRISNVTRERGEQGETRRFIIRDTDGRYHSKTFTVATGVSIPFMPDIPGIELTENYFDMSIDPKDYAGQRLMIIGKGNAAFETANQSVGGDAGDASCQSRIH